jgi:hypothetical protein
MLVILSPCHEAGSHRILDDVPRDRQDCIGISEHAIVIPLLPEARAAGAPSEFEPRSLFRDPHERAEIGVRRHAANEKVRVVWHEAIRENFKRVCPCRLPKMQQRGAGKIAVEKRRRP